MQLSANWSYHKIPKISPGAYIFQRPLLRGLCLEGLIYGGKFAFQNIGLALSVEGNLPFLLCFTLYLRAIYKPPGGLYLEGRFKGGFFCVTSLEGLYLQGLIHGGAYFRNFTVYLFY